MAPAWRRMRRQRIENVLLVVARAEELPSALDGLADATTIHFPWGSLLRGVLEADAGVASGLARITRAGADVTAVLSVTEHERSLRLPALDDRLGPALAERYVAHGLTLADWRPATRHEIEATHSSWAKRLGAGDRRSVWRLRLVRERTLP
jgi:16S rRNA (adenine(1408)-N(1))-methyltransferase